MSTLKVNTIQNTSGASSSTPEQIEQGRCKAWIKSEGASATILDDFGFSSMTDHGTGQMTFTFTTSMSNTNYCVVGAHAQGSRTNPSKFWFVTESDIATGSFRTQVNTATGGQADLGKYYCAVFGDQ
tara:strand:- start:180 stop:560 length:381 start_codon:yes stop_codon:yes gene_type:complete